MRDNETLKFNNNLSLCDYPLIIFTTETIPSWLKAELKVAELYIDTQFQPYFRELYWGYSIKLLIEENSYSFLYNS